MSEIRKRIFLVEPDESRGKILRFGRELAKDLEVAGAEVIIIDDMRRKQPIALDVIDMKISFVEGGFLVQHFVEDDDLKKFIEILQKKWLSASAAISSSDDEVLSLSRRLARLEDYARRQEIALRGSNEKASALWHQNTGLQARLEAMETSTSWRVTRPLRGFRRVLAWVGSSVLARVREIKEVTMGGVRRFLVFVARTIAQKPRVARILGMATKRIPAVHSRLVWLACHPSALPSAPWSRAETAQDDDFPASLTRTARRIYRDLQKAVAAERKQAR